MARDVFISYSSKDKLIADAIRANLENVLAVDPKSPNILYAGPESNTGVYVIRH